MKIIDTFLFFNEIDLLELRLETLYDQVDYFCVVEANQSHGGLNKPYFFEEYQDKLFKKYKDKIIYHKVDGLPPLKDDTLESRQLLSRYGYNQIAIALVGLGLCEDDIIIFSDLDEIPDPAMIKWIPALLRTDPVVVMVQEYYRYFVNNHQDFKHKDWAGSVVAKFSDFSKFEPFDLRFGVEYPRSGHFLYGTRDRRIKYLENSGWHFTYFGGNLAEKIKFRQSLEALGDADVTEIFPLANINLNYQARYLDKELMIWIDSLVNSIIKIKSYEDGIIKYPNLPIPILNDPKKFGFVFWLDSCA
jgi:hypothetical protein